MLLPTSHGFLPLALRLVSQPSYASPSAGGLSSDATNARATFRTSYATSTVDSREQSMINMSARCVPPVPREASACALCWVVISLPVLLSNETEREDGVFRV